MWAAQVVASYGGYRFKIAGYGHWFVGSGKYDSATGNFAGELICDPDTYPGSGCGTSGDKFCTTNTYCAWNYGINTGAWRVHAYQLPVNTVTSQW